MRLALPSGLYPGFLRFHRKQEVPVLSAYRLAKLLFTFSKSGTWGLYLVSVVPHVFNPSSRDAVLGRSL